MRFKADAQEKEISLYSEICTGRVLLHQLLEIAPSNFFSWMHLSNPSRRTQPYQEKVEFDVGNAKNWRFEQIGIEIKMYNAQSWHYIPHTLLAAIPLL